MPGGVGGLPAGIVLPRPYARDLPGQVGGDLPLLLTPLIPGERTSRLLLFVVVPLVEQST